MNPLFNMMGGVANPVQNMMGIVQKIQQIRQNPNGLADLLLNNHKIDQQTYEQIKNYDPQQMGQYLMQTGTMARKDVDNAMNNVVQPIQNALNQR